MEIDSNLCHLCHSLAEFQEPQNTFHKISLSLNSEFLLGFTVDFFVPTESKTNKECDHQIETDTKNPKLATKRNMQRAMQNKRSFSFLNIIELILRNKNEQPRALLTLFRLGGGGGAQGFFLAVLKRFALG